MPVHCQHTAETSASPERAFALIDDLPRTKEWLGPCTGIEKATAGPNAAGDRLKYHYRQGGRSGTMDGEIVARTPNERLVCRYFDAAFEVLVDMKVAPAAGGSRLTHDITITPRSRMAKLMTPCIRLGLRRQTRQATDALKRLLDANG